MRETRLLIYIMVDSAGQTVLTIEAAGSVILQPLGGDPGKIIARFAQPALNAPRLYQETVN
jgi:hypothetical protein